jgi:hypothetical protein
MRGRDFLLARKRRCLFGVAQLHGRELRRSKWDFIERQVVLGMRGRDFLFAQKRRCLFDVAKLHGWELRHGKWDCIERQNLHPM